MYTERLARPYRVLFGNNWNLCFRCIGAVHTLFVCTKRFILRRKMKNTFRTALSVCLVTLVCSLIFAACNSGNNTQTPSTSNEETTTVEETTKGEETTKVEETTEEHICSFGDWITVKKATCTENGEQERTCACGEKETRSISISHNWSEAYEYDKNVHWQSCTECDDISEKAAHNVGVDGYCTVCDNPIESSAGVLYSASEDGTYAEVTGYIGNSTRVVIAEEYEGLPVTHIANRAFINSDITSIVIPDSITNIGNSAFYNCDKLKQVENGIVYVDKWVIGCDSYVTSASLRSDTVGIADNAFYWCENLTSITIPDSVKIIGNFAFYSCTSLTGITIPDGVTSIGGLAFWGCTSLTSINIPDGVTNIGNSAFNSCTSLTSITIPDGVRSIGKSTFRDCTSLSSIYIPDSVTSIGDSAFFNCANLTSITIPDNVTSIDDSAFYGCYKLIEIYNLSDLNIEAGSSNNGYAGYYAKNVYTDTSGASKLTEKDGYIFYCDDTTGEYYLMGYTGTDIDLTAPYDINGHSYAIYQYAFYYCSSITSVVFPENSLRADVGYKAFYYCSSLTNVVFSENSRLTGIGDHAFASCSSLASINIPDGVTSIGDYAFIGCSSLTSINIPDGVTSIGVYSFAVCKSLASVVSSENNQLTSIGDYAFIGCSSLTSVAFIESSRLTSIGDYAFSGCSSLTSVAFVESSRLTSIGDYVFHGCTSLASVVFPENSLLTDIGDHAFEDCTSLTSITIPDSVTSIGDYAFHGCTSLASINIPGGVASIGVSAFYGCTNLTSVAFAESSQLTSIGDKAFYGCTNLTSITIPDGVTSIGNEAFLCCYKLIEVYNLSDLNIEVGSSSNGYVGRYAKKVYTDTSVTSKLTEKDGYIFYCDDTTGEYYLIGYIGAATDLTIPDDINGHSYAIYRIAFYGCTSLTSITIPDSVTSIGDLAFAYCASLTSITIPNSVTSIGDKAFYDCASLTNIYYTGTEEEWAKIGANISYTTNDATIVYNYVPEE